MDTKVFGRGRGRVDIRATGPALGDDHSDMAVVVPRADQMATLESPLRGSEPEAGSPRGSGPWPARQWGRGARYPPPPGTRKVMEAVGREPLGEDDRGAPSLRFGGTRAEAEGGFPSW